MIFSGKDYREAFAEVYQFGVENAKPLDTAAMNDMFGALNELTAASREDPENGKLFLKLWLMKGLVGYLCNCFKEKGG